ncbi:5-formyltetrahydrofolate cyclo-ligase [Methylacidiphilum caldifontis]|uniref:5-formyltetrahydrofolate cyclo-ligase n=1 Tax=Methylacidiphilum caldifontis TaxID=2795386 RepID=UPI001A8DEB18|nr:5-formyltetrahydrofolate cyclo-ligase [Methylacidiphilum caldifontis]QSR89270.1 5-formyltetrahydrofolate cyclo-ligase [Methylacidiphilum caldifontis]
MAVSSTYSLKQVQRRLLKSKVLGSLRPKDRITASMEITHRLCSHPVWQDSQVVALYSSLPSEPDTSDIFRLAKASKKTVLFPRVDTDYLRFFIVDKKEDLEKNFLNIMEPRLSCIEALAESIDLILIPGVGFDRQGHRLGRGLGFYDRFLSTLSPRVCRIGLFFSFQEIPKIYTEPHDQRLDLIITEKELIQTA